jgi:outer membrane protein assembly factor BamB
MTRACRPLTAWRPLAAALCAATMLVVSAPAGADTCSGLSLGAPVATATGLGPSAVAVGDFNRDGKLDVVTANQAGNTVSVLMGDGSGLGLPVSLASVQNPVDVVAGDLDRDGLLDLVVASGAYPQVMVYRGQASSFAAGVTVDVAVVPTRILLADFNRDGVLDLVVVSAVSNRVRVLKGLGTLGFDPTPLADLYLPGNPGPMAAVAGDFTGDGRLDLAVAEYSAGRVDVFVGNGTGPVTPGPSVTVGIGPRDLSAGDVDRDGRLDLVVANETSGEISVLLGQGNGSFLPGTPVPSGGTPTRLALADLDRDGALDLAAVDAAGRLVAFQGGGTAPAVFSSLPFSATVTGSPRGLAVGDFTSDARPDLVTALSSTSQAALVANQSGWPCARSSFAAAPRSYLVADGPVAAVAADFDRDGRADLAVATANDSYIRVRRAAAGDFVPLADVGQFSSPPRGLATADFDFDGQADLVAALGDAVSGRVQVILRDGTGAFTIGPSLAAGTNTAAVAVGDFDGNGAPDVAAVSEGDGSVWVFLGDGAGGFTPFSGNPVLSGLVTPRALVAADLTGDGLADLAVAESGASAIHVLRASVDVLGTLTFVRVTPTAGLAVGTSPESIAAGDVDGDGQVDLVTADNASSRVSVIRRANGGGFLPAEPYTTGANPTAVALLDLTDDGWLDVAVTTSATRTLTVLANYGAGAKAGTFFRPLDGDYPVRGFPRSITPIDADGDGRLDLAVACQTADSVVVLLSRAPGLDVAPDVHVATQPRAAVAADLDGDGRVDLAVANLGSNSVSVLLNKGAGTFERHDVTGIGAGPESIVAGDFNRDGHVDLALNAPLASPTKGVQVLLGTATPGSFTVLPVVGVGSASAVPSALAVGDFDRDGILDLAVCDKVSAPGWVRILRGDGSGGFSLATSVAVGDQPTAIVAADFNRDGFLDLAIANEGTDDVQILLNSGGSFTGVTQTLTLPGTDVNPLSIAAADFDGDGDADLAVAAFLGDRVHVYRNDGGTFTTNPVVSLDAPYLLRSVTAADVNLDGRPDLLAVATGLSVFRGRGALAFEPPETVMAGWLPQVAVVAELSGDGWPDVAVVNEDSGNVSLLTSTPCQARRLEVWAHPDACEVGAPPYTPAAEVHAYDEGGNLATCASGTVVPSIVPGTGGTGAVLGGSGAAGLPLSNGIASFTGLTIDRPGRRYQLQFALGALLPVRTRSFTLGPTLQILGTPSMCSGTSSTFSTGGGYDAYVWTLTPATVPPAYTPTVTLRNPPVIGQHTLALSARVDGCSLHASQVVFGGELQSTVLAIEPANGGSVCVDCIGGTITPSDLGGGPVTSRQWGYRTVSGTGAVTDMPGETGGTYVLKGASFPGPGVYYVVVRTTPTCGAATLSAELTVQVLPDVPGDEVQHLAVTSRGTTAGGGQNLIQWVNPTANRDVRIRWNKAPAPNSPCVPPAGADAASDGLVGLAPASTLSSFLHNDDGTPPGLDLDTAYCYGIFVQTGTGWSRGRTVQARPFNADSGPVKWAYSTGATAVVPPVVGYDGILVMSNDRTVHSITRGGANGGHWPAAWVPYALTGVAHSRSPVVPFGDPSPIFKGQSILFAADDTGDVHAIDASNGLPAWPAPHSQGKPLVGAPGGLFIQYGGVADLIIVGTRDTTGPDELRGLAAGAGTLVGSAFTAGGTIGPISGSPAVDYTTQRAYFTSRSYNGGDTVWCVQVDGTTPFNPVWSRNLGDVDGSPVLRNGRVYLGSTAGVVYSLDAATGTDQRTFTTGDGPVKGFVFPDRRNDDLIFATNTKVFSVSDTGAAVMPEKWEWTVSGLNPSVVLYWPRTSYVYVGSRNGSLYELDFTAAAPGTPPTHKVVVLGDGLAQVGAPSLDIAPPDVTPGKKLLVVGSESGTLYGVEVPF